VAAAAGKTFGEPLARMKGAELEHIRFQHPLYARASLGVLGDYVTLEAGTGAVHTAPGHGADDFNTGMKYGLEIYAPIGPAGHFLDTVELFGGQRVFDANPNVEAALKERGKLWHREAFSHTYRIAGAATTRSSFWRRRSGSSRSTRRQDWGLGARG
jgi:isoleucyl-tRNA synthetase